MYPVNIKINLRHTILNLPYLFSQEYSRPAGPRTRLKYYEGKHINKSVQNKEFQTQVDRGQWRRPRVEIERAAETLKFDRKNRHRVMYGWKELMRSISSNAGHGKSYLRSFPSSLKSCNRTGFQEFPGRKEKLKAWIRSKEVCRNVAGKTES